MNQKLDQVPDVKLLCNLRPIFDKNCQFLINFIRGKWSQFGIIEAKTAHDQTLVEREINPAIGT